MSTRTTLVVSLVLILIAVALSGAVYNRLPERVASHWDANDQVNGTMSRFWGAFLMPLIALAMLALFLVIPGIDPLKANIAAFRSTFNAFIVAIIVFLVYIHVLTILWNLGYHGFRMSTVLLPAMGLLFILVGLLISRAKRNFFIGIRTPWTLSSDRVWAQTHRVGAVLFVACGVLAFFGVFFPGETAFLLVIVPILACTLFLTVYSWWLYRQEQAGR
jgi:uncharacterized membrane protein